MTRQHKFTRGSLPCDGTVDQPDDAAVPLAADDCEFTEVLVQGDEDAVLHTGPREDHGVTWVDGPVPSPDDIVSQVSKSRCCLS